MIGGQGDDQITGDAADNTLDGGPGADVLRGLDGNDTLLARDGVLDTAIYCDGGTTPGSADSAVIDTLDPAPTGCESVSPGSSGRLGTKPDSVPESEGIGVNRG